MNNPIKLFFKNDDSEKKALTKIVDANLNETVKVDLRELGYEKAGATKGNLESLKNILQNILNGYMVDVNEDEETQYKEKEKIKLEQETLNSEKISQESELKKITSTDIPDLDEQISGYIQDHLVL